MRVDVTHLLDICLIIVIYRCEERGVTRLGRTLRFISPLEIKMSLLSEEMMPLIHVFKIYSEPLPQVVQHFSL